MFFLLNRFKFISRSLLILPIIGMTSACLDLSPAPAPVQEVKKKKTKPPHLVETIYVNEKEVSLNLVRTGTLKVRREVQIYNQVVGKVTQIPLSEGDRVKKGTLLVQLDDALLQAELTKVKAIRKQSEQNRDRIKVLVRKKLTAADELSRALTEVEKAVAEETLLLTRLGYTRLHAPFSGVISERLLQSGDIAPLHSHLMTLIDPTSMITEIKISELMLTSIKKGAPVSIRIDALGPTPFSGRIEKIFPNVNPVTRLVRVEISMDKVPDAAAPGLFCRVTLNTKLANRRMIPFSALQREGTEEYLYIVNAEEKIERKVIQSGLRIGEEVEVLDGVEVEERVVIKGFLGLKEGKKVKTLQSNPS